MTALEKIKAIQIILDVVADGRFGPKSRAALDDAIDDAAVSQPPSTGAHDVLASSFADPADVASFRRCKARGGSDNECFKVGDNGIGVWGDDTTGPVPMCALPPEDWKPMGSVARGKKVIVRCGSQQVVCELRDTMPARANIKNGAGIDLNAAAWGALGHTPPVLLRASWQWA